MNRTCPHCGAPIKGHPNKVFCNFKCKDRYHNKRNPRGFQAARALADDGEYSRYAETIHPFSQEAFEP